jgi:hypothetical protein
MLVATGLRVPERALARALCYRCIGKVGHDFPGVQFHGVGSLHAGGDQVLGV